MGDIIFLFFFYSLINFFWPVERKRESQSHSDNISVIETIVLSNNMEIGVGDDGFLEMGVFLLGGLEECFPLVLHFLSLLLESFGFLDQVHGG